MTGRALVQISVNGTDRREVFAAGSRGEAEKKAQETYPTGTDIRFLRWVDEYDDYPFADSRDVIKDGMESRGESDGS